MNRARSTRRGLLATLGVGLATSLAGCGYQPGAGDLDWTLSLPAGLSTHSGGREWIATGDFLVSIRNRSGRTYDHDRGEWIDFENARLTAYDDSGESWSATTDSQYAGEPAAAGDGVYVPLEDGRIAAFGYPEERVDERSRGEESEGADTRRWTTNPAGESLALTAGDDLVVAASEDGVAAFDVETGSPRFVRDYETASFDDISALAVDEHVWLLEDGDEPTLYSLDADGSERGSLSLPSGASWLEAVDGRALVGTTSDGVVRGVDADGDQRFALEVGGAAGRRPLAVDDRVYFDGRNDLVATDVSSGDRRWSRENPFAGGAVVADGDGLYGRGFPPERGDCGLVAIGADGEDRWTASLPDGPGCSGDLFVVGDRLLVVDGSSLYSFRTGPGSRYSVV